MDFPPKPWEELFEILRSTREPVSAAHHWLKEAKFSSLYQHPLCFKDIISYLLKPLPSVDKNQLVLKPRIAYYAMDLQLHLLEFLSEHVSDIPREHSDTFFIKCYQYHLSTGSARALHYLFLIKGSSVENSSADISLLDSTTSNPCMTSTNFTKKSRKRSSHEVIPAPKSKKLKVMEVQEDSKEANSDTNFVKVSEKTLEKFNNTTDKEILVSKLKLILEKREPGDIISFLVSENGTMMFDICETVISAHANFPEDFLSEACSQLMEKYDEKSLEMTLFLKYIIVPWFKYMDKAAYRTTVQALTNISTKHPSLSLENFMIPAILVLADLNSAQVNLLTILARKSLQPCHQISLLTAIINKNWDAIKSFDKVITLFQGFVNLKLELEAKHLDTFTLFLHQHASKAATSFPFAKLILSFVKIYAAHLSDNLSTLNSLVDQNKTTLKVACKTALTKVISS